MNYNIFLLPVKIENIRIQNHKTIKSRHGAFVRNMRIVADYMKHSNQYNQRYRMSYIPITNEKVHGATLTNLAKMDEDLYMKILYNFSNDFAFKNNFNSYRSLNSEYVDIGLFAELLHLLFEIFIFIFISSYFIFFFDFF